MVQISKYHWHILQITGAIAHAYSFVFGIAIGVLAAMPAGPFKERNAMWSAMAFTIAVVSLMRLLQLMFVICGIDVVE